MAPLTPAAMQVCTSCSSNDTVSLVGTEPIRLTRQLPSTHEPLQPFCFCPQVCTSCSSNDTVSLGTDKATGGCAPCKDANCQTCTATDACNFCKVGFQAFGSAGKTACGHIYLSPPRCTPPAPYPPPHPPRTRACPNTCAVAHLSSILCLPSCRTALAWMRRPAAASPAQRR